MCNSVNISKMKREKTVSKYLDELVIGGKFYFTLNEIGEELSMKNSSVSSSLSRLAKTGKILMIRKGFGIITGLTSGTLHPSYFIDGMMKYLGVRYYVGLLNAASYKGAGHQAVMNYTVVVDKVLKPIQLEGLTIYFVTKNNFDEINEIEKVSGSGGYFMISGAELTAIDLVRFQKKSGHLSNIATVLEDLFDDINIEKLKAICVKRGTPTTTLQRLGYLLDKVLEKKDEAEAIHKILDARKVQKIILSVGNKKDKSDLSKFPLDKKWNIVKNVIVEPD